MIKYENGSKDVFNVATDPNAEYTNIPENKDSSAELLKVKSAFFGMRYYQGNQKISKANCIYILKRMLELIQFIQVMGYIKDLVGFSSEYQCCCL